MSLILALALGVSALLFSQIKVIRGLGDSVVAFYAADSGIERELYEKNTPPFEYSGFLDLNKNRIVSSQDCPAGLEDDPGDACYLVKGIPPGPDCQAEIVCIRSYGFFKGVSRAIQAVK
jgi:hypothetical protein